MDDDLDQYFQQQCNEEEHAMLIDILETAATCLTDDELKFLCRSCGVDEGDL